jgi:tellurite resistance-related uncharacterized protein
MSEEQQPYRTTPVFDEKTLPEAIRSEHRTKAGTWGPLRVIEGEVDLVFVDPPSRVRVNPASPAPIPPQATHYVELDGPMRMQVEFYREPPEA